MLLSFELRPAPAASTVEATWLPAPDYLWLATTLADAAGVATLQSAIPNAPALRDIGVWLHALDVSAAPWQVSPPIGGMLR